VEDFRQMMSDIFLVKFPAEQGISATPVGVSTAASSNYRVTSSSHATAADHQAAARSEFGSSAKVAEWDTIKSSFGSSVSSITKFMDGAGIILQRSPSQDNYFVTKSGQNFYGGSRRYFVTRHNGSRDGSYLYHDLIQNYQLGLGSYTYNSQVLAEIPGTANGTYRTGDNLTLVVSFSKPVTVTGTPKLKLETGEVDRFASYVSGSGTDNLSFSYTVQSGDNASDLDYHSTNALELNGGTLKDSAGTSITLTLPAPGSSGSLAANRNLVIDGSSSSSGNSHSCNSRYYVTLEKIDDSAKVYVNGSVVATKSFGYSSQETEITSYLRNGQNKVVFELTNGGAGYAYTYKLRQDSNYLVNETCGNFNVYGCNNNSSQSGIVVRKETSITCGSSTSPSSRLLGGNIQERALSLTSEVSTIASGTAGHGLTTDGTFLYACASPVKKIRISNPSEVTTVSGASCTYDLTTDGTYLYVLEGPWGPVTKMSVNGGSKTTVYSGSFSDSNGVTTDGSFLYIFDGGHVKKINLSNNQFVTNLQHSGARGLRGTMVRETLYISGSSIRKISTSGSNFATLISGVSSEGLGSDGTHIYYADGSTLKRYTIASGAISTVKSGLGGLRGIVTDGTHLYGTVTGGQVKKIRGQ